MDLNKPIVFGAKERNMEIRKKNGVWCYEKFFEQDLYLVIFNLIKEIKNVLQNDWRANLRKN
jgi:hypothetical protein